VGIGNPDPNLFWICAGCQSPHLMAHYDLACRACGKIRPGCESAARAEMIFFVVAVVVTLIGALILHVK
jgi:hypothetical protein